jgi:PHD/YefM family antitoxin component YafN of YafNO toxin-antitoxin module
VKQILSTEAARSFGALIDEIRITGEPAVIFRYRTPAVVIVPVEWFRNAQTALGEDTEDGGA